MTSFIQNVIQNMHVVVIDIEVPGFSTKASLSDYGGSTSAADKALSTGGLKLINQKDLNPFLSVRRRVTDSISSMGSTLKGGAVYLVPDSKIPDLENFLCEQQNKFFDARNELGTNYQDRLQEWWNENPTLRDRISSLAPSWNEKELEFKFEVVIRPMGEQRIESLGDGGLTQKLQTASELSISQICEIARSYNPKEGSKASSAQEKLEQMIAKSKDLEFCDPTGRLSLLADYIQQLKHKLPAVGRLEGPDHFTVSTALAFLGHEEQIQRWLDAKRPASSVLGDLLALTNQPSDSDENFDEEELLKELELAELTAQLEAAMKTGDSESSLEKSTLTF